MESKFRRFFSTTSYTNQYKYEKYNCHTHSKRKIKNTKFKSEKMVLLDQLWDDVAAGPQPDRGLKHLKKVFTNPNAKEGGEGSGIKYQRSLSMPSTPSTPGTPTNMSPTAGKKDNVWRSVFNPGSNSATKNVGSDYFDKPQPNSPTVYDWLYSGDTRSKHHERNR